MAQQARKLSEWLPEPDELLKLSAAEIGNTLLNFCSAIPETDRRRNVLTHSYIGGPHPVENYPERYRSRITQALLEAWQWLEAQGFIVPEGSRGNHTISRAGEQHLATMATDNNKYTIFYSWQSDLPNATNRGFINDCLDKAIKELNAEGELEVEPCLDRDTLNLPGSPDIAKAIFDKIDNCHLFVGDVSITNYTSRTSRFLKHVFGIGPRPSPNPNVLVELGYAAKRLTWDNIVSIVNQQYGEVGQLPFDLRQRRTLTYRLRKGQGKAEERTTLVRSLKDAINDIIGSSLIEESNTLDANPTAEVLKAFVQCGPPENKPKQDHIHHIRPEYDTERLLWVTNAYVHFQPKSTQPLNVPFHRVSGVLNETPFEQVYFKSDPRYAIKTTNATLLIEGEGRFQVEGAFTEPFREGGFPETLKAQFHLPISELNNRPVTISLTLRKKDGNDWPLCWEYAAPSG